VDEGIGHRRCREQRCREREEWLVHGRAHSIVGAQVNR
jgi:calcineurin-like phosphoesterase family protein